MCCKFLLMLNCLVLLKADAFVGDKHRISRQARGHGNNRELFYSFPSLEIMDISIMAFQN